MEDNNRVGEAQKEWEIYFEKTGFFWRQEKELQSEWERHIEKEKEKKEWEEYNLPQNVQKPIAFQDAIRFRRSQIVGDRLGYKAEDF